MRYTGYVGRGHSRLNMLMQNLKGTALCDFDPSESNFDLHDCEGIVYAKQEITQNWQAELLAGICPGCSIAENKHPKKLGTKSSD
eukprot:759983-Hanusia_phi.AAC.2